MIDTFVWPATVLVVAVLAFIRTRPVSRKEIDALAAQVKAFGEVVEQVKPHLEQLPPMYKLVKQLVSDVTVLKPQKALFENWDVLVGQFEDLKRVVEKVQLKHLGQKLTGQGSAE